MFRPFRTRSLSLCTVVRRAHSSHTPHDIAAKLGFSIAGQSVDYSSTFTPFTLDLETLIFIPHGRTPSNEKLLFQSYEESINSRLLSSSRLETSEGADLFLAQYSTRLKDQPNDFIFLRSPLKRTEETAEVYLNAFQSVMAKCPTVHIDSALLEIDHASWHGKTVSDMHGEEQDAAAAYRAGSFLAAPCDGESNLDLLWRCSQWLQSVQKQYPHKIVCVFGHGTFQNAVETLLCSYGATLPCTIFTRKPGESHMKRGYPHAVFPPFHSLRTFNT